jgi:hypothetical protein
MKERGKYLKKGQVLVFFLIFIALCGLIVITVGIDIFRVSQTKIMLQTATDGRALHVISLFAKQLNFLADVNRQMLQPAEDTYFVRCNYDKIQNLGGMQRSGGIWSSDTEFRPWHKEKSLGADHFNHEPYGYNWEFHTEGHGGCVVGSHEDDHTCNYPGFAYQTSPGSDYDTCTKQFTSVSTPSIWDEPPKVNEFDVDGAVSDPERAFPSIHRMEEYKDDFIKPRADLQDTVLEKIGGDGGLIMTLAEEDLELGEGTGTKVSPDVSMGDGFDNYKYSYWKTHRKEIDLPYIVWDYHTSSWTHSYQSGTQSGFTCTVRREWWTVHKDSDGKDLTKKIGGWLYFDDGGVSGDAVTGSLNVTANREMTGLKFGSEDHIKEADFKAEASVELDSSTGELWPEPDSSYRIKFK